MTRTNYTTAIGLAMAIAGALLTSCGSEDGTGVAEPGPGGEADAAASGDGTDDAASPDGGTLDSQALNDTGAGDSSQEGSAPDGSDTDASDSGAPEGGDTDSSVTDGAGGDVATDSPTGDDGGADAPSLDAADEGELDSGGDGAGGGDGGQGTVPACSDSFAVYGPLSTAVNPSAYGTYDPGPLMLRDDRAFVFLEGSDMWMTASHGAATTGFLPAAVSGGSTFAAWRSMSGRNALAFSRAGKILATSHDGVSFTTPVETPCTSGSYSCEARAAGDGHLWLRTGGNFYEQESGGFANRGGGPVSPTLWDVDAQGTVIVLGSGNSAAGEVLAVWKLVQGAGGWTKAGALLESDIAAVEAQIEGGFQFGANGPGTIAPDGSIHLFSDARCVGTGDHNKVQAWLRSHDGVAWEVQTLPSADDLTGGLLTWRNVAFWAADYERVRYVVMSSPAPTFDGYTWYYPDRRYDVIVRCEGSGGEKTFTRAASVPQPGWTSRGFAGFSDSGVASLLTSTAALSQVE